MTHIMTDLETLGTVPGCIFFSIGAVELDPREENGLGREFYKVIEIPSDDMLDSPASFDFHGLHACPDTRAWWARQSPEARATLIQAQTPFHGENVSLRDALQAFGDYIRSFNNVRLWGNGADFDNPILACGYRAVGLRQPWAAYNGRCYRTVKAMRKDIKLQRVGTYHNALDDAKSQALHLIALAKAGIALG